MEVIRLRIRINKGDEYRVWRPAALQINRIHQVLRYYKREACERKGLALVYVLQPCDPVCIDLFRITQKHRFLTWQLVSGFAGVIRDSTSLYLSYVAYLELLLAGVGLPCLNGYSGKRH